MGIPAFSMKEIVDMSSSPILSLTGCVLLTINHDSVLSRSWNHSESPVLDHLQKTSGALRHFELIAADWEQCPGAAYYVHAAKLYAQDYQTLLNHGWRRSGALLYKPEMRNSCCPHYTIRLPVRELKVRKDQRSACNRWNKFVLGEDYDKQAARLHPRSRAQKAHDRNVFDLADTIHRAELQNLPDEPPPLHKFEVTLEPAGFSREKYELYLDYQTNIHGDSPRDCEEADLRRFLCDSPLVAETVTRNGRELMCGSFHQCYRLDGKLIAMGVLDLLPSSISAVYFMYRHDFEQHNFGKLSALREASLARENGYEYYSMGYYIHSCTKMRYKNDFQPQYFLDLDGFSWHRLDENAQAMLEQHRFYSPNELARKTTATLCAIPVDDASIDNQDIDYRETAAAVLEKIEHDYKKGKISLFDIEFVGMQSFEKIASFLEDVPITVDGGQHIYRSSV